MSDLWWGWLECTILPVSHSLGIFLEERKSSFAREGGGQWEEGGVGSGASLAPPVSAITCSRYCRRSQVLKQHPFWWSLEPFGLWRVSGVSAYARTLLLDPATSTPPPKDPYWKKYIIKISMSVGRYKSCWPKREHWLLLFARLSYYFSPVLHQTSVK